MDQLTTKTQQSRADCFNAESALMGQLAHGQHPEILYIGCSDSRIMPSHILGAKPGDVFVMRNVANVVPPLSANDQAVGAVLEYAVKHLHVAHIVVCGHALCGGIQSLSAPPNDTEPALGHWLDYVRPAQTRVPDELAAAQRLDATIEANVLVQIENLRTYPFVQAAEQANELEIHGWVYDFRCGRIRSYDQTKGLFVEEVLE